LPPKRLSMWPIQERRSEPPIPPGADEVTRSLIQLKSPEVYTRKRGAEWLGRITPDNRLTEVVAALVPQPENDDQRLMTDTVKFFQGVADSSRASVPRATSRAIEPSLPWSVAQCR
jgi:hypothetical protein